MFNFLRFIWRVISQALCISEDVHSESGSGECDADPVADLQEPNSIAFVASHQREQDDLVLLALEIVHSHHSNILHPFEVPELKVH